MSSSHSFDSGGFFSSKCLLKSGIILCGYHKHDICVFPLEILSHPFSGELRALPHCQTAQPMPL